MGSNTSRIKLCGLPLTLAVALGPLIGVLFRLTQPVGAGIGGFSMTQVLRGILCVLMCMSLCLSRGLRPFTRRFVRPLLCLTAYALATSLAGPYPYQHIVFAMKVFFLILIFLNAAHLAAEGMIGERWLTTCAWIVLGSMVLCIGIGLATGKTPTEYNTAYATAGLMNHVSIASFFILSVLPVFLKGVRVSWRAMVGAALVYALLFFTMCRSALIAACAAGFCCAMMSLISFGRPFSWRKALVPAGIILLLVLIGLNTPAGADLITRFKDLDPSSGSGSGRYTFWKISLEHIAQRPTAAQVWGDGVGSIRNVLKERFGLAIGCHNDALDCVAAFGVWGLIGMVWWYYELARLAWSLRGGKDGLFPGVCASTLILIMVSLGTGGILEPPWALTYAALGVWSGHVTDTKQSCNTDTLTT